MFQDGSRRHSLSAARGRAAPAGVVPREVGAAAHRSAPGAAAADRHSHLWPRPQRQGISRSWRTRIRPADAGPQRAIRDPAAQISSTKLLSRARCSRCFRTCSAPDLSGAVVFEDGQMYNAARLVLAFVKGCAVAAGADACNYVEATKFLWRGNAVAACARRDRERRRIRRSRAADAERGRALGGLPAERSAALRHGQAPALLARCLFHRRSRADFGIRRRHSGT